MLTLGITGGPGTGKSTVLGVFKSRGIKTYSSDSMVRSLQKKGSPLLSKIKKAFGKEFITKDGRLNRIRLRKLIFENAGARTKLEKLTHPLVNKKRSKIIRKLRSENCKLAAFEVPLLFEVGLHRQFDYILTVSSSMHNQVLRLKKRMKISKEQAAKIIASQMPLARKRKRSDFVISNNGTKNELRKKTIKIIEKILKR